MSQDHSDRFFESDSFFLKVGQRPVTRAAEEKRFPRAQPCTCTSTLHSYINIYMVPHPPHVPTPVFSISALGSDGFLGCPCSHAFLQNLSCRTAWVNGIGGVPVDIMFVSHVELQNSRRGPRKGVFRRIQNVFC